MHGAVKALVPAAGAAAGFGVSHLAEAAMAVQLLCAAVPVAVLLPAMIAVDRKVRQNNIEDTVQEYLEQLELFRRSVLGILSQ